MRFVPSMKLGAFLAATSAFAAAQRPTLPNWLRAPWAFLDATGEITQATASRFRAATAADFDGDGDDDVVVVAAQSAAGINGTPAAGLLYMNEGGRFVDRTAAFLPQLANNQVRWWSVAADFCGPAGPPDGLPDLFVAGGQGEASKLFMNRGRDGSNNFLGFEDASARLVNSPITGITHSYTARAGDFNGDGLTDLLVLQYKPNLGTCSTPYAATCYGQSRLLINSNGSLVDETATRLPARNEPSLFGQVGDFNRDGHTDIALVNLKNGLVPGVPAGVPSIRVMINDGTGIFLGGDQVMPERSNPTSALGTYSLEVGDFNRDRRPDIFVINWGLLGNEARDAVLLNLGSGQQLFPGGTAGIAYPLGNEDEDDDGDHPSASDLDGDGDLDVVVAQFSARPYFLINETRAGRLVLRESTPSAVPTGTSEIGFRNMIFDANRDGVPDVWLALRDRNFLVLGGLPEREPNGSPAAPNAIPGFPALGTGIVHIDDTDVFALPQAAVAGGARVRLRPAAGSDLRLRTLDAAGNVLATAQAAGNGAVETIDAGPGAHFVRVERQGPLGGDFYRLEILRPGAPLAPLAEDGTDVPDEVRASARWKLGRGR